MSDLPKDWEAIANDPVRFGGNRREAVERCYALHCATQKELSNEECYNLWLSIYRGKFSDSDWVEDIRSGTSVIRRIIAAHIRKQREPETVTFRAARNSKTGDVDVFKVKPDGDADNHYFHSAGWEWLEPPQTFEVKLP